MVGARDVSIHLVPCPNCRRHIRCDEAACPFCGAKPAARCTASAFRPIGRMSRAALVAAGTAGSLLGALECGGQVNEPTDSGAVSSGSSSGSSSSSPSDADREEGMSDGAPMDAPTEAATDAPRDAPREAPSVVPPYGLPPPMP
jgi:hypothetical protein